MDRRESLKTLLISSLAAGAVTTSCQTGTVDPKTVQEASHATPGGGYGRTEAEQIRDQLIQAKPSIFNEHELLTLGIVADIILPADDKSGSATEAGVVDFIDYIVKEITDHQIPVRAGLAWMDRESNNRFEQSFKDITEDQRIEIVEDIAYPFDAKPEFQSGANLFSTIRNLVMTGFYTSEMGIKDIGYMGNVTNFWDGVPDEVLEAHGFEHDPKYVDQYITQEKRNVTAKWDEEGNLIYEDVEATA